MRSSTIVVGVILHTVLLLVVIVPTEGVECEPCRCDASVMNCTRKNISKLDVNIWPKDGKGMNIKTVDLSENELKVLDDYIFSKVQNLLELNLSGNRLTVITSLQLKSLGSILELDLSRNEITNINSDAFSLCCTTLSNVDLSYNSITRFTSDVFSSCPGLTNIDLSYNQIVNINFTLNCPIETLDLRYNKLDTFEAKQLNSCSNLSSVYLAGNNVVSFNGVTLPLLSILDLSNTSINGSIPEFVNRLSSLKCLNVSQNKINEISDNIISDLKNLQKLDLSRNELISLEANLFDHNRNLTRIDLSHNNIESIDRNTFNNSTDSDVIKWNNSPLCTNISSKRSTSIISHLDLSFNRLNDLNFEVFSGLGNLTYLNLENNSLKTFDFCSLRNSRHTEMNLDNNPIVCNNLCNIYRIVRTFNFTPVGYCNDFMEGNCTDPKPINSGVRQHIVGPYYVMLLAYVFLMLMTIFVIMTISYVIGEPAVDEFWWQEKVRNEDF